MGVNIQELEYTKFKSSTDVPAQKGVVVVNPDGSSIGSSGGGGGIDPVGLKNASGVTINPATSEGIGSLLEEMQKKADKNEAQSVDLTFPDEYPLPAAQVSTLTPPAAITGFATSDKQLPDNHNVTVSNQISVADLETNAKPYDLQVDTTTANVTYIGEAEIGSAMSAAVWRIKRIDTTSGVAITWANDDADFDNIWDNRVTIFGD